MVIIQYHPFEQMYYSLILTVHMTKPDMKDEPHFYSHDL